MQAALLPDRGVVKVTGEDARRWLNGLLTVDLDAVGPDRARFAALLTPQGKIIADFIVAQAKESEGGDFFLDCPRALALTLVGRLNMYKLRAKVIVEDLSDILGVVAVWGAKAGRADGEYGLTYADPRLPELGMRIMAPPHRAGEAAAAFAAQLAEAEDYERHRITLCVPRGGIDFIYGDAFPHETDMDQLGGVDFDKGCYVGQEVVSRTQHRGTARTRILGVRFAEFAPEPGLPVVAGERQVGTMGSGIAGQGLAMLRLDRVQDAVAAGLPLTAGGIELRPFKPDWARFDFAGAAASVS